MRADPLPPMGSEGAPAVSNALVLHLNAQSCSLEALDGLKSALEECGPVEDWESVNGTRFLAVYTTHAQSTHCLAHTHIHTLTHLTPSIVNIVLISPVSYAFHTDPLVAPLSCSQRVRRVCGC